MYYVGSFAQTSRVLFVVMKNWGFAFPDEIKWLKLHYMNKMQLWSDETESMAENENPYNKQSYLILQPLWSEYTVYTSVWTQRTGLYFVFSLEDNSALHVTEISK